MRKSTAYDTDEFDTAARLHVYHHIIDTGEPPNAAQTATALNRSNEEALDAYRRLHHEHVLVLAPDATTIRMAMPFSAIPTSYRVTVDDRSWWANWAWDSLGVAAMLHRDARIVTRCGDCDQPMELNVRAGELLESDGVVHFAIPVARWWDDVGFTWSTILLFRSEEHVDRWCAKRGLTRGETISLDQCWRLAKAWYAARLDPGWQRNTPEETRAIFAEIGLDGDFWRVPG